MALTAEELRVIRDYAPALSDRPPGIDLGAIIDREITSALSAASAAKSAGDAAQADATQALSDAADAQADADTAQAAADAAQADATQALADAASASAAAALAFTPIIYGGTGTTVAGTGYVLQADLSWALCNASAEVTAIGPFAIALGTDPAVDGMLLVTADYDMGANVIDWGVRKPLYISKTGGKLTTNDTIFGAGEFAVCVGYCGLTSGHVVLLQSAHWVKVKAA